MEMEEAKQGKYTNIAESLNTFRAVRAYYKNYKILFDDGFDRIRITETEIQPPGADQIRVSHNGAWAAALVNDTEVRLWNLEEKAPKPTLLQLPSKPVAIDVSSTGYLAVAQADNLQFFRPDGSVVRQETAKDLNALEFFKWTSEQTIVIARPNAEFEVFDIRDQRGRPISGEPKAVSKVGHVVYQVGDELWVWHKSMVPLKVGRGPWVEVRFRYFMEFSPNGEWLAIAEAGGKCVLWNLRTRTSRGFEVVRRPESCPIALNDTCLYLQQTGRVARVNLAFGRIDQDYVANYSAGLSGLSFDGNLLALLADNFLTFHTEATESRTPFPASLRIVLRDQLGQHRVIRDKLGRDQLTQVWVTWKSLGPDQQGQHRVIWDKLGRAIILQSDGSIRSFSFGAPHAELAPAFPVEKNEDAKWCLNHSGRAFAFQGPDLHVVVASVDGSSQKRLAFAGQPLLWSHDDQLLACQSLDGKTIALIRIGGKDEENIGTYPCFDHETEFAFTPENQLLALGQDRLARWRWNALPPKDLPSSVLERHLSPDGLWIASRTDKEFLVHSSSDFDRKVIVEPANTADSGFVFSPAGRALAASSKTTGVTKIWQLSASGQLKAPITLETGRTDYSAKGQLGVDDSGRNFYSSVSRELWHFDGSAQWKKSKIELRGNSLTSRPPIFWAFSSLNHEGYPTEPSINIGLGDLDRGETLSTDWKVFTADSKSHEASRVGSLDPKRLIPAAVEVAGRQLTQSEVEEFHLEGLRERLKQAGRKSRILPTEEPAK